MFEYGKTENIFERDPDTHKLIQGKYRTPEVGLVRPDAWMFTEKVDGTNVRLILEERMRPAAELELEYTLDLRGRTDRANLPGDLTINLDTARVRQLFRHFGMPPFSAITFYGEAYGAGIQKGGMYSPTKRMRFFDMVTQAPQEDGGFGRGGFRPWSHLEEAAGILGLNLVPVINFPHLSEAVYATGHGIKSVVAEEDGGTGGMMEGLVGRTEPYIYDFRGNRVFFKVKTKDLQK